MKKSRKIAKALDRDRPNAWRGLIVGAVAGLAAAAAMSAFQAAATRLSPAPESDDDPADVKAADVVARASGAGPLSDEAKPFAGAAAHFALGAALGAAYGLAAEYRPEVTSGNGAAFGSATALVLDEATVPALGLARAPTKVPAKTHLFGLSSHLVFGATTEAVRSLLVRLVRR
jgi:hypothetical protein